MHSWKSRRFTPAVLIVGALASAALAFASPASATTVGRVVQVGPGRGEQCVSAFATTYVRGSGGVTNGTGANMQLRYQGTQVLGSGAQVPAYAAETSPGFPGWNGSGFYEFCARNNGSAATVSISIQTA